MDHRGAYCAQWITVVHLEGSMQGNKSRAPSPVRIPEELKQWLKHKAVDNFRSLNREIVARLERSRKEDEAQHANAA